MQLILIEPLVDFLFDITFVWSLIDDLTERHFVKKLASTRAQTRAYPDIVSIAQSSFFWLNHDFHCSIKYRAQQTADVDTVKQHTQRIIKSHEC